MQPTPTPTQSSNNYEIVKDRTIKWCQNLYQDGIYDYKQYQACLSGLDSGAMNLFKYDEEPEGDTDYKKKFGYIQTPEEKITDVDPSKPMIKDDFVFVYFYHLRQKSYLLTDDSGKTFLDSDPVNRNQREWQLVSITVQNEADTYIVKGNNGNYLTGTTDNTVNATSKVLSPWAQWKLIKNNDNYALFSIAHKKYLAVSGDDLILADGWSDNNLWFLKKKTNNIKGFIDRFNPESLNKTKDTLCNLMYDSYSKTLDFTYDLNFYENKVAQLEFLRRQQLQHLIDITDESIRKSNDKRTLIGKSITDLTAEIENLKTIDRLDMAKASQKFQSECNMDEKCLNAALSFNNKQPGLFDKLIFGSIDRWKSQCNWTDDIVKAINARTFNPTEEYCLQLKAKADDLTNLVAKNKDEYINMLNRNIEVVNELNEAIAELEVFKSDMTEEFTILIENEKTSLINFANNASTKKKEAYATYSKTFNDIDVFMKQLIESNQELEITTNNIADDIDENLEQYDKMTSTYEDRKPAKSKSDLDFLISSNRRLPENKIKNTKIIFYLGILETLCLIAFTIYIFIQAFTKLSS